MALVFLVALLVLMPSRFAPVTVSRTTSMGLILEHDVPGRTAGLGARGLEATLTSETGGAVPDDVLLTLYLKQNNRPFRNIPMRRVTDSDRWSAELPAYPKGSLIKYRIEARLAGGAWLTLPPASSGDHDYRYLVVAPVPRRVSIFRDAALWLSFVLAAIAAGLAARARGTWHRRGDRLDWSLLSGALAGLSFFAGAICLSWIHAFYATGTPWATITGGRNHIPFASLGLAGYWGLILVRFRKRMLSEDGVPSHHAARASALLFGAGALGILLFLSMGLASP